MGTAEKTALLEDLLRSLEAENPDTRSEAIRKLRLLGTDAEPAVPLLTKMLREDPSPWVRYVAVIALAEISTDPLPLLSKILRESDDIEIRATIARSRMQYFAPESIPLLIETVKGDEAGFVRRAAVIALGSIASNVLFECNEFFSDDTNKPTDAETGEILAEVEEVVAKLVDVLAKVLQADDLSDVRDVSVDSLAQILIYIHQFSNTFTDRSSKSKAFGLYVKVPEIAALLTEALREDAASVIRLEAVHALAKISLETGQDMPALDWATRHESDERIRRCAAESLRAVKGRNADALRAVRANYRIAKHKKNQYDNFLYQRGHEGPVPSLDDKIKELTTGLPEDYDDRAAALAEVNSATRRVIADQLTPALNARIQAMPHETLEQKKELARFVNAELEPLGLAVRCPKTGLPAKLRGVTGNWPGVGCFNIEIYTGGKQKVTKVSDQLPELTLTDATPPPEPEKVWQQAVKSKENPTGRRR